MTKINIAEVKAQLAELKRKETVAQTREQFLSEEKQKILLEITSLLSDVDKLRIIPKEELNPQLLSSVIEKLYKHIEEEVQQCDLPQELLK